METPNGLPAAMFAGGERVDVRHRATARVQVDGDAAERGSSCFAECLNSWCRSTRAAAGTPPSKEAVMAGSLHPMRFPGESDKYRDARDELLEAEIDLRRRSEEVAAQRRRLPLGGLLAEDYVFEEGPRDLRAPESVKQVRFSQLFEPGKDTLVVYSFMYGPQMEKPCPMCTSMLDGLDGQAPHITQRVNLVVAAKSPIRRIREHARERGWTRFRLVPARRGQLEPVDAAPGGSVRCRMERVLAPLDEEGQQPVRVVAQGKRLPAERLARRSLP